MNKYKSKFQLSIMGVLNRIDEIVESTPLKIFIMIGINDIGDGLDTNMILARYKEIIESIKSKSPKTKIYIQSVLPCNINLMEDNERNSRRIFKNISDLNEQLIELSAVAQVTYIDLMEEFKDENSELIAEYSTDDVPLNENGYLIWKNKISNFIYEQ